MSTAWTATRAPQLLPHMGSQVPRPWDPQGGRPSGVQGGGHACPGHGQWVDPVEPKSFPRPQRPFPGPASGVNTPTCAPAPAPLPRAWRDSDVCPCRGDGVEGCPPSSAMGGGWPVGGSTGLHHPARGWWAQVRPRGRQGGSVHVWGKVGGPTVQGVLDTWGPGGRAGGWANTCRGSRRAASPCPGPALGHCGLQATVGGPLPSPGGAGGTRLLEARARECDLPPGAHASRGDKAQNN